MSGDLAAVAARNGWRVREPVDDDGADLAALVGGVFAEYSGCVLDPEGLDADLSAWATHLANAGGRGWLVHDTHDTHDADDVGGVLVACVGVVPCPPPPELPTARSCVELKRLYVRATARRRGLGRALVTQVEAWARQHAADGVVLWSDTRFTDAHRLYTACGYIDTDRRRELHDPSDTTEAAFVRALP